MSLEDHTFAWRKHFQQARTDSDFYDVIYNGFAGQKIFGLYAFAFTQSSASSASLYKHHGIMVSSDGVYWQRLINLPTLGNIQSFNLVGVGPDGNLWSGITPDSTTFNSFYCSFPNAVALKGALVERAGAQSFNNTPTVQADGGTLVTPYTPAGGDPWVAADMWNGSSADIRWYGTVTAEKYLTINGSGLEVIPDIALGDQVFVSFRIKGKIGDGSGNNRGAGSAGALRIYAKTSTNTGTNTTNMYGYCYLDELTADWQWVTLPIVNTAADITGGIARMGVIIYTQAAADPEDQQFDILIDGVTFEKAIVPAEYHPQATARAAEVLSYAPASFPAAFTDIFSVGFRFGDWEMAAPSSGDGVSYIYIRSYSVDADNFIALVYDVNDKKFKIVNEVGGTNTVVSSSSAVYLTRDEVVSFAIIRSGTTATAYFIQGGTVYTLTGTITNHTLATMYWGSHPSGGQGGSLVYLRDVMYDSALAYSTAYDLMVWPDVNHLPQGIDIPRKKFIFSK
jgi:hypothetical protein